MPIIMTVHYYDYWPLLVLVIVIVRSDGTDNALPQQSPCRWFHRNPTADVPSTSTTTHPASYVFITLFTSWPMHLPSTTTMTVASVVSYIYSAWGLGPPATMSPTHSWHRWMHDQAETGEGDVAFQGCLTLIEIVFRRDLGRAATQQLLRGGLADPLGTTYSYLSPCSTTINQFNILSGGGH